MRTQRRLRLIHGGAGEQSAASASALGLDDDVGRLAAGWWGRARGTWASALARDLIEQSPAVLHRHRSRSWVAAVLVAAAIAEGRHVTASAWEQAVAQIEQATGTGRGTAFACWRKLAALGLTRPLRPPAYWEEGWECVLAPHLQSLAAPMM